MKERERESTKVELELVVKVKHKSQVNNLLCTSRRKLGLIDNFFEFLFLITVQKKEKKKTGKLLKILPIFCGRSTKSDPTLFIYFFCKRQGDPTLTRHLSYKLWQTCILDVTSFVISPHSTTPIIQFQ